MKKVFINKYSEFRALWGVAITLLVNEYSQALLGPLRVIVGAGEGDAASEVALILYYVIVMVLMVLIFKLIYRKQSINEFGLYKSNAIGSYLIGCAIGIIMIVVVFLLLLLFGAVHIESLNWGVFTNGFWLILFFGIIPQSACEEFVFRGLMMKNLKTCRNKWIIILLPAVLFGLVHIVNPNTTVFSTFNIVIAGLFFGVLYYKTGNLLIACGIHFTWNAFQGFVLGSPISGQTSEASLINVSVSGNDLISGGVFGYELSIFTPIIFLLGTALAWKFSAKLTKTHGFENTHS